MSNKEKFIAEVEKGYTFEGESITIGGGLYDKEAVTNSLVKIPLSTLNRHGLIAGATGSGKTKTLQILAEQLSAKSVPVLLMDIKGDLSGIAAASAGHPKIDERHAKIGIPFEAGTSPVEFLSLSEEKGARLRATVTEFGPVLFSKILALNDTQSGIVSVVFEYCDNKGLPLLDLDDFKKTLQYIMGDGKDEFQNDYGRMSTASTGAIMRKIVELQQQDADLFFGETSFDVEDLCRFDENGKGMVNVIRLTDLQDRPKLFSTFMLQLLAEIYSTFPEEGDIEQPKLVIFIDEAHLVFKKASDALMDMLEAMVKLIRSKGVGLFFVTQNPADIPEDILGQLGLKVQHALRAFTAKDRKAIKLAAQNYPITEHYDIEQLLTELGIGEAFVTALNEKGIPTPLVHTLLRAPQSRMDVLEDKEIDAILKKSALIKKYNDVVDTESAKEMLSEKITQAKEAAHKAEMEAQRAKAQKAAEAAKAKREAKEKAAKAKRAAKKTTTRKRSSRKKEKSALESFMSNTTTRQVGRTIARELTRGFLGILGIKRRR